MKLLFTLVLFLSSNLCIAQSKHSLKQEVKHYSDSIVESTTYNSDKITFRRHVFSYFISNNFTVASYNDSVYVFSKYFRSICSNFNGHRKGNVVVYVSQIDSIFNVSSKAYWGNSHKYYNCKGHVKYMKSDLKIYLYIMHNGTGLKTPEYLQKKIKDYNSLQTQEKHKLIEGRDY